jgi:hypothetical protein
MVKLSKPVNQTNNRYNLSSLAGGYFFKNRPTRAKNKYTLLVPLFALPVGLTFNLIANHGHANAVADIFVFIYLGLIVFAIVVAPYSLIWEIWLRPKLYKKGIENFESANELHVVPEEKLLSIIPASIKAHGPTNEFLRGYKFQTENGPVIVFDYSYSTGSGKSKSNYSYAVASLRFPKKFPHLYLDARVNGKDDTYATSQEIQLEGNFNEYFRLFMPEGSSAGSLALLSPDVMQMLIDVGAPYDIEIDGHSVAVISPGRAFTRETLQGLLLCADSIYKDLNHLERSWQPIYDLHGKPYNLQNYNMQRVALYILGLSMLYFFAVWALELHM